MIAFKPIHSDRVVGNCHEYPLIAFASTLHVLPKAQQSVAVFPSLMQRKLLPLFVLGRFFLSPFDRNEISCLFTFPTKKKHRSPVVPISSFFVLFKTAFRLKSKQRSSRGDKGKPCSEPPETPFERMPQRIVSKWQGKR